MIIIAKQVWQLETFILQDGTEVDIKPLNIKNLRKFMTVIGTLKGIAADETLSDDEKELQTIDKITEAATIAIAKADPELAKDTDRLEDILDVQTIHKILEVAGGVKLNDPNLVTE